MSGLSERRVAGVGRWAGRLSPGRFVAFVVTCLVAALALEEPLAVRGAAPDFVTIALVYTAIRLGATRGAVMGFALGLFRDSLYIVDFGLHALGMTVLGYVIGKARETLYLSTRGVEVLLVAGAKLVLEVLVLGVAAAGAWEAFELRFFWEAPGSALYTAALGAVLYRMFAQS